MQKNGSGIRENILVGFIRSAFSSWNDSVAASMSYAFLNALKERAHTTQMIQGFEFHFRDPLGRIFYFRNAEEAREGCLYALAHTREFLARNPRCPIEACLSFPFYGCIASHFSDFASFLGRPTEKMFPDIYLISLRTELLCAIPTEADLMNLATSALSSEEMRWAVGNPMFLYAMIYCCARTSVMAFYRNDPALVNHMTWSAAELMLNVVRSSNPSVPDTTMLPGRVINSILDSATRFHAMLKTSAFFPTCPMLGLLRFFFQRGCLSPRPKPCMVVPLTTIGKDVYSLPLVDIEQLAVITKNVPCSLEIADMDTILHLSPLAKFMIQLNAEVLQQSSLHEYLASIVMYSPIEEALQVCATMLHQWLHAPFPLSAPQIQLLRSSVLPHTLPVLHCCMYWDSLEVQLSTESRWILSQCMNTGECLALQQIILENTTCSGNALREVLVFSSHLSAEDCRDVWLGLTILTDCPSSNSNAEQFLSCLSQCRPIPEKGTVFVPAIPGVLCFPEGSMLSRFVGTHMNEPFTLTSELTSMDHLRHNPPSPRIIEEVLQALEHI